MITTKTDGAGAIHQTFHVGARTFEADLDGSAPSPHDYFDASLATCKALTAHVYAKARGYALERVEVDVDRDASQEKQGKYTLRVSVRFFGALGDDEKRKIYDAIQRCPIHKLMTTSDVAIETAPLVA
ncbi:MAG TPA: OsmC family protein [Polyangiaceae bacterium]|jgi:putative redox protein|nr:OsmC family protein [Polyangiaceae bacterium]